MASLASWLTLGVALLMGMGGLVRAAVGRGSATWRFAVDTALVAAVLMGSLGLIVGARLGRWEMSISPAATTPPPRAAAAPLNSLPAAIPANAAPTKSALPASRVGPPAPGAGSPSPVSLIFVLWLAGAAVGMARLARDLRALREIRGTGQRDPDLDVAVRGITQRMGMRRSIVAVVSPIVAAPVTWGAWRPCIALPRAWNAWTGDALDVALAHELVHVQRRDHLWMVLTAVMRSVLWYHPGAWIVARWLGDDMERSCDELAIRSGIARRDYARHLVTLVRAMAGQAPRAATALVRRATLEGRVSAILRFDKDQRMLSARGNTVAVLVIGASAMLMGTIRLVPRSAPVPLVVTAPVHARGPERGAAPMTGVASAVRPPDQPSVRPGPNPASDVSLRRPDAPPAWAAAPGDPPAAGVRQSSESAGDDYARQRIVLAEWERNGRPRDAVAMAERVIGSEHYRAGVFRAMAAVRLRGDDLMFLLEGIRRITGGYARWQAIQPIGARGLSTPERHALLAVGSAIAHEHYRVEFLRGVGPEMLEPELVRSYLRAIGTVDDGYARYRVLEPLVGYGHLDDASLASAIDLAAGVASEHSRSLLAERVGRRGDIGGAARFAFERLLATLTGGPNRSYNCLNAARWSRRFARGFRDSLRQ